jgi:hypothetical protein
MEEAKLPHHCSKEEAMVQTDATTRTDASEEMTSKPLIESDRVEGTAVYDPSGNHLGSIKRLMIEKISGKVAYAVMSFGGFLGMGEDEHTIPWSKLTYDTSLGGYRTDITEEQLRGAPSFYRDSDDYDWSDRERERELHDYWRTPYYWGI